MNYFVALLIYFLILICISLVFSRRSESLEDFFLASRNLGAYMVFFSVSASWLGAASTLVSVDEGFRRGVSGFWVMGMPTVVTVLIFAFVLARPIRRLSIVSLPDLVEMRYGRIVRHGAALLIVWYMILLAASQMVALGNFLKTFIGGSYVNSLIIGTAVVLIYSVIGGFFSVVVTDAIQLVILIAGIGTLFILLLKSGLPSSVGEVAAGLGNSHYFDFFYDVPQNLLIFVSFTMAWLISPITWQRIQGAKGLNSAVKGLGFSSAVLFLFYGAVILIGMMSLSRLVSPPAEGNILSVLISSHTGPVIGILLFVAITSAIMSTMDTVINTGALSLTRDVFLQLFPRQPAAKEVLFSRISTLAVGFLAFCIATRFQNILQTLGLASAVLTEGMFIPGMVMLFSEKKRPVAGFLSLSAGGGYALLSFLCEVGVLGWHWPEWPSSMPLGILLCGVGFLAGSAVDSRKRFKLG